MSEPASVEGAYGTTPRYARLWLATAFIWMLLALPWGFAERHWWLAALYLVIAVGAAYVAWAARRRTVVEAEGVRARQGLRRLVVAWPAVAAVTPATHWESPSTLRVRTHDGHTVATDVPNDRYDAFVAYAVEHGANPSLGEGPGGGRSPRGRARRAPGEPGPASRQ